MKKVPFFDLTKQNKFLKKQLDMVWRDIVDSKEFILGSALGNFEKHFARFTGTKFAVGVSTGLDALSLSLRVLGVGPGDEVILPTNSFIATALAVSSVGARPIFSDVDPNTLLIRVENIKKVFTSKAKAVIPVHLYGQPVEMQPLLRFCRQKGLRVIEDACQAHGARIGNKRCGSFGDLGCFSFYPSKNLGAFGDGGMVTTNDEALRRKLQLLRNYGSIVKYHHEEKGYNMRLDTLQAAVLDVKLKYLDGWNRDRNAIAGRYARRLAKLKNVRILPERKRFYSAWHLYVIRTERRDQLKKYLEEKGVSSNIHYPIPIHLQGAYNGLRYREGDFPVAEKAADEVLSLPMYPEMSLSDVDRVCEIISNFFKSRVFSC